MNHLSIYNNFNFFKFTSSTFVWALNYFDTAVNWKKIEDVADEK